jgi:DNA topoisomerase VI subunit B
MAQVTAEDLAKKQRDISIAEFFEKNRHLLGFDNPRKALLTTIKEAVDNSLDACEEAHILPEISVEVFDMQNNKFRVIVEDNGPGIVKEQIPKIFAKLLYGSKFHSLKQQRGQQGIGISAAVLYSQLTTGRPAKITSKTGNNKPAHYYELKINTEKNAPEILKDETKEWPTKEQGTRIELDLEASYLKGNQSVDEYLKQTAIVNPHVQLTYLSPKSEQIIFPRVVNVLPQEPKEIKPHPYGLELGMLMKMLKNTESKTLQHFLTNDLSRVGGGTAKEICENALLDPKKHPDVLSMQDCEKLIEAIKKTKIMAPSTDCITPIGEEQLEKGIRKEINAEYYCSVTRQPEVYRGNPFIVECAIAYGGNQQAEGPGNVIRFANRVPLLYQQGACAITKSITSTNWKAYGLQQSNGSVPQGAVTILVHIASVWVPFTSESKEAIAHYPEIIKEIKLALQDVGRKLSSYLMKKRRVGDELKKRSHIEKYIPMVAEALQEIMSLNDSEMQAMQPLLKEILEKYRGKVEDLSFDESKNEDFDESLAGIGTKNKSEDSYLEEEAEESEEKDEKPKKGKKKKVDDDE